MTPKRALDLYFAIKWHFTSLAYDAVRYNFKNKKFPDIKTHKDRPWFEKLAKRPDVKGLLVANLSLYPRKWIGDVVNSEGVGVYMAWKKRQESLTYSFGEELGNVAITFPESFRVDKDQHPELLKMYLRKDLSLDTMVILNDFLSFMVTWNKALIHDPVWKACRIPLIKYGAFFEYDFVKTKRILLDKLSKAS